MTANIVNEASGPFYLGVSGSTPQAAFKNLETLYLDLRLRYGGHKEEAAVASDPQETPSTASSVKLQVISQDARDLTREEVVRWFYEITPEAREATKLIAKHRHGYTFPEMQEDMGNPPNLGNALASVGHAANRLGFRESQEFKGKKMKVWLVNPMFNTVQVKGVYRYRMSDTIAGIIADLPITLPA